MRKFSRIEVIALLGTWTLVASAYGQGPVDASSQPAPLPASGPSGGAAPADRGDLEVLKQRLEEQGRRIDQQQRRIEQLLTAQAASEERAAKAQHDETVKILKEWEADAKKHPSGPPWLDGLKLTADVRLRYQADTFGWGAKSNADKEDRDRARFRVRFGLAKTWLDDQVEAGFRLASGNDNSPQTENQTFGESGGGEPPFAKRPVWIDLAYARYSPKDLKGLSITAGKITSPWLTNDTFWSSDLNPEGFWANYKAPGLGAFEPFVGAGYFILNERSGTEVAPTPSQDSTLWGTQAGLAWKIDKDMSNTAAGYYQSYSHYDFTNAKPLGNDKPLSNIPDFHVVGLVDKFDFKVAGLPVGVWAEWARNLDSTDSHENYTDAADALAIGASVGQNKKKGDWAFKYRYVYVEANAIPGQFVDSTFATTNRKGHIFGPSYNILDNMTIGANVYITDPIFSPTTGSGSSAVEDRTISVLADLVWRF